MSYNCFDFQGKDFCDREAAYIKNQIDRFISKSECSQIINAEDLYSAILCESGSKKSSVSVLEIDRATTKIEKKGKVPNISYYHSQTIDEKGIKYKEYYGIGEGKSHEFNGNFKNLHHPVLDS